METYLRFQTPLRCNHTARPLGIFAAAGHVETSSNVDETLRACIGDMLDWFGDHLHIPTLDDEAWRALFWFRASSRNMVTRMWDLVTWVREAGMPVQMQRTRDPGKIVYIDKHQVAAVARRGGRKPSSRWSASRV
jgi:hypothetical protein